MLLLSKMTLQDLFTVLSLTGYVKAWLRYSSRLRTTTCASELGGAGDASALEKYYHRTGLRSAQRTSMPVFHSNVQVIRTVCDEQLLLSIQTTIIDGVTLNMGEVNDAYLLILKRYQVEVDEKTNYRKHLKQLITEHLPNRFLSRTLEWMARAGRLRGASGQYAETEHFFFRRWFTWRSLRVLWTRNRSIFSTLQFWHTSSHVVVLSLELYLSQAFTSPVRESTVKRSCSVIWPESTGW